MPIALVNGGRLNLLALYQACDQIDAGSTAEREHYFGALHLDGTEKGAYSPTVRELLAAR
jgi:hypothetical protein